MLAPALALLASLGWGVADFLAGLRSRKLPLVTVLVVVQAAGFTTIGLLVVLRGEAPPGAEPVFWGMLAGVCAAIGIAALYRALAIGTMSIVAPITATGVIVPVTVGLASGDDVSGLQDAGIVLAFCGVVLAARERDPRSGRARVAAGVGLAVLAAVVFGFVLVALDASAEADPLWATFSVRATSFSLIIVAALVVRPPFPPSAGDVRALAPIGVIDTSCNALFAVASTRAALSIVAVLAQVYPVFTVLLARFVLHERIATVQKAGVAAAFLGVVLITVG